MAKHSKEENQYFGGYFEQAVCAAINKQERPVPDGPRFDNYTFAEKDLQEIWIDAIDAANFINGTEAHWVGDHTSTKNGDLIVDGEIVELKYVEAGLGTHINTTADYTSRYLDFPIFCVYLRDEVLSLLAEVYGEKVYKNTSPLSSDEAKDLEENHPELHKQIQKLDKEARKRYVKDLYNYLLPNQELRDRFLYDMVTKACSGKALADKIYVYNKKNKTTTLLLKEDILNSLDTDVKNFKKNPLSIKFNKIRISIGWQNRIGCNPTLRVSL